jgi:hypothetical protein
VDLVVEFGVELANLFAELFGFGDVVFSGQACGLLISLLSFLV